MHMQGTPATMQLSPHYDDVVAEIAGSWKSGCRVVAAGHRAGAVVLDPGIGFGKTRA